MGATGANQYDHRGTLWIGKMNWLGLSEPGPFQFNLPLSKEVTSPLLAHFSINPLVLVHDDNQPLCKSLTCIDHLALLLEILWQSLVRNQGTYDLDRYSIKS